VSKDQSAVGESRERLATSDGRVCRRRVAPRRAGNLRCRRTGEPCFLSSHAVRNFARSGGGASRGSRARHLV